MRSKADRRFWGWEMKQKDGALSVFGRMEEDGGIAVGMEVAGDGGAAGGLPPVFDPLAMRVWGGFRGVGCW